jgi:hypothetical protein
MVVSESSPGLNAAFEGTPMKYVNHANGAEAKEAMQAFLERRRPDFSQFA